MKYLFSKIKDGSDKTENATTIDDRRKNCNKDVKNTKISNLKKSF